MTSHQRETMSHGRGGRSTNGRRSGRGGRGRTGGRSRNNNNSNQKNNQRTKLSDYIYNVGSAKQASDFIIVNEYLINYVRKNYEHGGDIGTALENMDHFNFAALLPTLQMSAITGTDAAQVADRTRENRQFELQYNVEYKAYSHRVDIYDQNKSKAYSFLWGQCSKAMQHKVESRPQFVSTIKNDPVELIKAIREYAMAYQDTKYPVLTILEAMQAYITIRQQDGESLVDYLKRTEQRRRMSTTSYM